MLYREKKKKKKKNVVRLSSKIENKITRELFR